MSDEPSTPGPENSDCDYEVGYGKPPKASQFKPGQSCTPSGHRKRPKSVRDQLEDIVFDPDNVESWTTNRNSFNASDERFFNRLEFDAGGRQDTTYDVDNMFAWDQRIQIFDAAGNLISEQFI